MMAPIQLKRVQARCSIDTNIVSDWSSGLSVTIAVPLFGEIDASLGSPYGVAVDSAGNIFIADTLNNRIRRVGDN